MPDSSAYDSLALRRAACELLVATHVAHALAEHGIPAAAEELVGNPSLRSRDLALFGLGSLDWMDIATRLEDETGMEFPDTALVKPGLRCVAGWAETLLQQGGPLARQKQGPEPGSHASGPAGAGHGQEDA